MIKPMEYADTLIPKLYLEERNRPGPRPPRDSLCNVLSYHWFRLAIQSSASTLSLPSAWYRLDYLKLDNYIVFDLSLFARLGTDLS